MNSLNLLRAGTVLALVGAVACGDAVSTPPSLAPTAPSPAKSTTSSDEKVSVSPALGRINARLAASGAKFRVAKAELLMKGDGWNGATSTVIIASDRYRGIGSEWVKGDPRREGRVGVTYAVGSNTSTLPLTLDPDGSNIRFVPAAQVDWQIEEGMTAWRSMSCSDKPIARVQVPTGTDPDYLDQYFRGNPAGSPNYFQPADIVQSGWQPPEFFRAIDADVGDFIIGVTFTFIFTDDAGVPTDIDRNARADLALAEIFYNQIFAWGSNGARNVVDFYSIITHETGHALGLGHFGKVFVTKHDAADGLHLVDVKYAPYAMMNAVYITGRNELTGTDRSSFCQIWAGN